MCRLSKKNVLIVGRGTIAKRHEKNVRDLFNRVQIKCISSQDDLANQIYSFGEDSAALQGSSPFNDFDLVIIASPAPLHLEHAKLFLGSKAKILIEKPICVNFSEIAQFIRSFKYNDIYVGYNLRYLKAAEFVKKFIENNMLGSIWRVSCEVGQYLPDWRPSMEYRESVSAQKKLGGGALLELSHELDYLIWLFGTFDWVSANVKNFGLLDIDVDEFVEVIAENSQGISFDIHLDFLSNPKRRALSIFGENGSLVWNLLSGDVVLHQSDEAPKVVYQGQSSDINQTYIDQLKYICGEATDYAFSPCTLIESKEVMRLIEAIRLSSNYKRSVRLSDIQ